MLCEIRKQNAHRDALRNDAKHRQKQSNTNVTKNRRFNIWTLRQDSPGAAKPPGSPKSRQEPPGAASSRQEPPGVGNSRQDQKIAKSELLEPVLSTSGANIRKSLNRNSWSPFYRFLEANPENALVPTPENS